MHHTLASTLTAALLLSSAAAAGAQGMPTSQPNLLVIIREEVKLGRGADHAKFEAGWPAAYEKAKSPDYYIALASMTGVNEVLYVVPVESHKSFADGMKRDAENAALSSELERLSKGDAEFVSAVSTVQAMARPDLSVGAYPDMDRQRFWAITTFRVRPGHDEHFAEAVKAYMAASQRASPSTSFRTYEVIAGAPGGTYLVFSSVASYDQFDAAMAAGQKTWQGATPDELKVLQSFAQQGMINAVTNRYRLDPQMSYVAAETKAKDPAFWGRKPTRVSGNQ